MPRKAFVADLQAVQAGTLPSNLASLRPGDEDGSISFTYKPPGFGSSPVRLQAQVTDVGDYPSEHGWFVYSISENVQAYVNDTVSDHSVFNGLKVAALIQTISKKLDDHTRGTSLNPLSLDSDGPEEIDLTVDDSDDNGGYSEPEDNQDDDDYDDEFDDFGLAADFASQRQNTTSGFTNAATYATEEQKSQCNATIRDDLRKLKAAGFRVSCCTSPFDFARDFYMTVSCRIAKLNISEDALAAWNLQRSKYILLIFHFTDGYKTFDEIIAESKHGRYTVSFRVAVSTKYKAPRQDLIDVFSTAYDSKPRAATAMDEDNQQSTSGGSLEKFFVDRPLSELMNGRFVDIARFRLNHNLSWDGAERFCQDHQAMGALNSDHIDPTYFRPEPVPWRTKPALRIGDHLASGGRQKSFSLIAMEFMLRHLVQCTEFCLVCHTKLDATFEALRPYVCEKPLCLYQYMALGFGPSIEHEILSQPHVVDLLVSFCYARAAARKLDDLPIGMGLSVPNPELVPALTVVPQPAYAVTVASVYASQNQTVQQPLPGKFPQNKYRVLYNEQTRQITFPDPNHRPNLNVGDWIGLQCVGSEMTPTGPSIITTERKIVEAWYPVFKLAPRRDEETNSASFPTPPVTSGAGAGMDVEIYIYAYKFDDLHKTWQQTLICAMLNQLPSVTEMRNALLQNRSKSLAHIYTDLSPAALGVLRWVIASNRSCIVAIDDLSSTVVNSKERVHVMPGYMQFRFAQGAPDKERRFIEAVQQTQARTNNQIPTLWAWHGSDVANWHSIIRQGLHYNTVANGRAYGDGIYNALDAHTSVGYSARSHYTPSGNAAVKPNWQKSELDVTSALSLNEIVNSPKEFRSSQPYLVVQNVDWVQTRILCVKCNLDADRLKVLQDGASAKPEDLLEQDKQFFPKGTNGQPLCIPANAISVSRRKQLSVHAKGLKKLKLFGTSSKVGDDVEEIFESDASDVEDRALIEEPQKPIAHVATVVSSTMKTDFVPGTLDVSKLPCLPSPPYATPNASKALTRALKDLQKVQRASPTAELGWHLCEDALDNIYQWIVELHTFDSSLPLYMDLKAKNLTSVVLELRFGPSYPFSPPFVRVIRPRFLGFQQGGGGHVTAGGALCMELLTNDGWSAVSSIEAVLLQVKMAISSTEPKPARLDPGPVREYSAGEAVEAYKRACNMHGWKIPPDFQQIASAGPSSHLGGAYAQY